MTFNCELCEKKPNELLLIVNVLLLLLLFIQLNMRNAIAINFYELSIFFFFMVACITCEWPINSHISSYHIVFFRTWTWNLNAFYICMCSFGALHYVKYFYFYHDTWDLIELSVGTMLPKSIKPTSLLRGLTWCGEQQGEDAGQD